MGLKDINVIFDRQHPVYFPGEVVRGKLEIYTQSAQSIQGIYVKFKGAASVQWSTSDASADTSDTTTYQANEIYFKEKNLALAGPVLTPGQKVVEFAYQLPRKIPPSFKGSLGKIEYSIKIQTKRPWRANGNIEIPLIILSHLDLRDLKQHSKLQVPVSVSIHKSFWCLCIHSGNVNIQVSLSKSGYVPGQTLHITVDIDNSSNVRILDLIFKLRKTIVYHSTFPRKERRKEKETIAKLHTGLLDPVKHDTEYYLRIPRIVVTNLNDCKIIQITYMFLITAEFSGATGKKKAHIPIQIGHVDTSEVNTPYSNQNM